MKRWIVIVATYGLAGIAALVMLQALDGRGYHPLLEIVMADFMAVFMIFGVSMFVDNSSIYVPHWSVAPIIICMWLATDLDALAPVTRQVLVVGLTFAWGVRLTYRWARDWDSLDQEHVRYIKVRKQAKGLYWPASFISIHLLPTAVTLLGCMPLWFALNASDRGFGVLDVVASLVTFTAIIVQAKIETLEALEDSAAANSAIEDGSNTADGSTTQPRQPSSFGETMFWWGIALFGIAAAPGEWWPLVGAATITIVSMPRLAKIMPLVLPFPSESDTP